MIRMRLAELMSDYSFRSGRRVEWQEVAASTGIHRSTLSKMLGAPGYNATISSIDALCRFFSCKPGDLLEYIADENSPHGIKSSRKGPKAGSEAAEAGARARHATVRKTTG